MASAISPLIHRQFQGTLTGCDQIAHNFSRYKVHGFRVETRLPDDHVAYLHDNPGFPILNSGQRPTVVQMIRLASRKRLDGTDFFNGFCRKIGVRDQLAIMTHFDQDFFSFTTLRDRPFSEDEYALMRIVEPHIKAAWSRVRAITLALPDCLSVVLTPACRLENPNDSVRLVLRAYFPDWPGDDSLPRLLAAWSKQSVANLRTKDAPLRALAVESVRGRLLVRIFPGTDGAKHRLLFVETPAEPDFLRLRMDGLTNRECEVLHWLAQGKRNGEIATIIGAAPRTVDKHVEHLRRKFKVESRGAVSAAARARLDSR